MFPVSVGSMWSGMLGLRWRQNAVGEPGDRKGRAGMRSRSTRWANPGDPGPDVLERVQRSLTVDMIMAPRDNLETCRCDEIASTIMARNARKFSYLPVVDETERILGLYCAARWFDRNAPKEAIGNDFVPFSEDIVIGADASIIDLVKTADQRQTGLVVSGDRVAGLVSLSDLQQLPVRAAQFTLITRLEIAMHNGLRTNGMVTTPAGGWSC